MLQPSADWHFSTFYSLFSLSFQHLHFDWLVNLCISDLFSSSVCVCLSFFFSLDPKWHFCLSPSVSSSHIDLLLPLTHSFFVHLNTGSLRSSMFWQNHKPPQKIFPSVPLIQMKVEYQCQTHASITLWTIFNLTGELFARTYQLTSFSGSFTRRF